MRVITLGRDATNDIRFADDPHVTRSCHCQLIMEDNGTYTVMDFSRNGTFVNNNKIPYGTPIKLGEYDVLQIGSSDALPWKSYFKVKTGFLQDAEPETKFEKDSATKGETKAEKKPKIQIVPPVSHKPEPRPRLESKHTVVEKQRHGFITFCLILGIIGLAISSMVMVMAVNDPHYRLSTISVVLSLISSLAGIVFISCLLNWKKIGFYGLVASNIIISAIGLCFANEAEMLGIDFNKLIIIKVAGIAIGALFLWAILQIRKNGVSCWDNLE